MPRAKKPREYSDEEKAIIGTTIAKILKLRIDPEYKDCYSTTWGSKTPRGIFEVVRRLGNEIDKGAEITLR